MQSFFIKTARFFVEITRFRLELPPETPISEGLQRSEHCG
jgi:hypothetical protein